MKLDSIAEVLNDAMRSIPWLVRVESLGRAEVAREFSAWANGGSLVLAALDRESSEVVDMVEYGGLERLDAAPGSVVAWAGCVAAVLARADATERISELIPAPALLVEPSLERVADFERVRLDVELEERCGARLRG